MTLIALDPVILTGALLGFIGGVLRVFVGVFKGFAFSTKIHWKVMFGMALISGVIGLFLGALFNYTQPLSLLAGFAGFDVIDSVLRTFKTQKVIVVPEQNKKTRGGIS